MIDMSKPNRFDQYDEMADVKRLLASPAPRTAVHATTRNDLVGLAGVLGR